MKKSNYQKIKGFTLVEMLLVIAIIGILAGSVYAMIGNSNDANIKSALSTAKSIMPYAQECVFKGNNLSAPDSLHDGGDELCLGSETVWPGVAPVNCSYSTNAGFVWAITCSFSSETVVITCNAQTGECIPVSTVL
jgi:prepilin-type N-terminal cleavage/methylation domain-containing protein